MTPFPLSKHQVAILLMINDWKSIIWSSKLIQLVSKRRITGFLCWKTLKEKYQIYYIIEIKISIENIFHNKIHKNKNKNKQHSEVVLKWILLLKYYYYVLYLHSIIKINYIIKVNVSPICLCALSKYSNLMLFHIFIIILLMKHIYDPILI